ncbi:peptidase M28 [Thermaerobacter marianensis DSM 12885]|uniref:Peptidase M28 n=1 Tax=Thermaerobacter marianensis (strain ATCC 700841 / DSM 12885 / JCM 10246 / 7p75a) TaxID=644966 RepID=E6SGM5_THEM7|nr:M20/M25/M40 family metallo-hydrolase [Thermaerobacter marianensis]ADU50571.1 peptidase M28 [Thermaerobacter marianensis DSM 12885]
MKVPDAEIPVPDPWPDLEALCRLPHRGTATPEEGRAARWLAAVLQERGYEVDVQPFTAPRHTLYLGPGWIGLGLAALALGGARWSGPAWGYAVMAAVAVLALLPLVGELALWPAGSRLSLGVVVPRGRSQNVVARLPRHGAPRGDAVAGPPLHVVVTAHYDTQWGSWLFAPRFLPFLQAFFVAGYAAFAAVPVLLAARALGAAPAAPLAAAGALAAAVAGFLLVSWLAGRPVNGANDNGSGVAVALALARRWAQAPLPGIELTVALTGAEETGMRGMAALLDHPWFPRHAPRGVVVVNVDNVGAGRLHYLTAEGMLRPVRYDRWLVERARELAAALPAGMLTPGPRPLLPTDALVPAARGIPAITFLGAGPRGRIPHYHWHTDRLEHVDRAHLVQVAGVLWSYLEHLARAASRPPAA